MPQQSKFSTLLVIFLTVFIDLVGFGIIIPLSPYLATRFGATPVDVGRLMAVYSLMQFIFSPVWGRLSDRLGRRPIILISVLGAAIAHTSFAFAQSLWLLFVARTFAGIFGANISTAMAAIADVTKPEERSKNMGLIGAAFGLGFILGPALGSVGGMLGNQLGSEPPFGISFGALIAGLLCLVNFTIAYFRLPETRPPEKRVIKIDRPSRFQLLGSFLQKPVVGSLIVIHFLSTLGMAHMEPMLFLYVKEHFGINETTAIAGFAFVGLMMVFTQGYLIRKLMPRFGERMVMISGLLLAAIGLAGIGLSADMKQLFFVITCLGLGTGMVNPSVTGSVSLLAAESEQGLIIGVTQSVSSLARIIGPEFSGHMYQLSHSLPFLIAGGSSLLGLLLAGLIFKQIPQHGKRKL